MVFRVGARIARLKPKRINLLGIGRGYFCLTLPVKHRAQHVAIIITFLRLCVLILNPVNSSAIGPSGFACILTIRKVVGVVIVFPFGIFCDHNGGSLWRICKLCPHEVFTCHPLIPAFPLDRVGPSATRPCTEQGPPPFPFCGATQLATRASRAAADVNIAAAQAAAAFWWDCVKE